ncbi:MAG TPA: hypothetical protein DHV12_07800 [Thermotogae bacterium]|nr:hypothetical protein [Thermotogota bacterium]
MKAGASSVCITPPSGVVLEGYASRRGVAYGVHDDLYVSSLWLEVGGKTFVFSSLDVLGIPNTLDSVVRSRVLEEFGVSPDNLMLTATHTHSGPALLGLQEGNQLNEFWLKLLPEHILGSIRMAKHAAESCFMTTGTTSEPEIGKNRRKPGGPTDPTLTAVAFWKKGTKDCIAVLINYACHATVLDHNNLLISSDFVGPLRETILNMKEFKGSVVLFFNGAEGDVNIGYSAEKSALGKSVEVRRDFETAVRIGKVLALDALLALEKGTKVDGEFPVFSLYRRIRVPARKPRDVEEIKRDLTSTTDELEKFFLSEELKVSGSLPQEVDLPLHLIRLPNLTIFALPVEPFSEIGLRLRALVKNGNVMIVSMANGWYGYLPTKEAFQEGGYETRLGRWSYLSEDAANEIVNKLKTMLEGRVNV